jgi:hypothetical protein
MYCFFVVFVVAGSKVWDGTGSGKIAMMTC